MKKFNGSAIFRHQVFTLSDGSYVVQWDEGRVQELLTAKYRLYDHARDFGHAITDYELSQLVVSGRVEQYNQKYVWVLPLPEGGRFGERRVMGRENRVRMFYLSTFFPKAEQERAQEALERVGLADRYGAKVQGNQVVIVGANGLPFRNYRDVELAQTVIAAEASAIFPSLTVAFVENNSRDAYRQNMDSDNAKINLDELIASQAASSDLIGKRVLLVVGQDVERQTFEELFAEMKLDVKIAVNASEALQVLEDFPMDLLIADIQLPDMHVFQMLIKAKEIERLRDLPVLVLTDQPYFGTTVARVDYMQRPISIARLRYTVYVALNGRRPDGTPPDAPSSIG